MSIWDSEMKKWSGIGIRELLHTSEIVVEPIERLLEPRCERESMAGFKDDLALVRGWRAQNAEERLLASFERNPEVVSPIDH